MVRYLRLVTFYFSSGKKSVSHASASHVTLEVFISKVFRRPCRLSLTQIVHSNDKMLFRKPTNYLSVSMARCSRLVTFFYFKEKFCVSARVGEVFVLKNLSEKIISRYLS